MLLSFPKSPINHAVHRIAIFCLCTLLLATVPGTRQAMAINASPHAFEEVQPDGTRVRLHVRGDERFNWLEDTEGYTVIRDPGSREYRYARRLADGRLAPGNLRVGRDNPRIAGLQRRLKPSPERLAAIRSGRPGNNENAGPQLADGESGSPADGPEAVPPSGTVKNLVILIKFNDHNVSSHPSQANYSTIFNAVGGHPTLAPTGSVRDVYYENSYGQMTLESTVTTWVEVPGTEAYYANGNSGLGNPGVSRARELIEDALDAANAQVDFGDFDLDLDGRIDSITFLHSGYGAEWGGSASPDRDMVASLEHLDLVLRRHQQQRRERQRTRLSHQPRPLGHLGYNDWPHRCHCA